MVLLTGLRTWAASGRTREDELLAFHPGLDNRRHMGKEHRASGSPVPPAASHMLQEDQAKLSARGSLYKQTMQIFSLDVSTNFLSPRGAM